MDKKTLINLIKAAGVKKVAVGAVSLTLACEKQGTPGKSDHVPGKRKYEAG